MSDWLNGGILAAWIAGLTTGVGLGFYAIVRASRETGEPLNLFEVLDVDLVLRWIPRHHWVRLVVTFSPTFEPGHHWMYYGIVRRDAWRIGRLGFGLLRMPRGRTMIIPQPPD